MDQIVKPLLARIFAREESDHYVEPAWCSARLFQVERFEGSIVDPACGWGTIVIEAMKAGYSAVGVSGSSLQEREGARNSNNRGEHPRPPALLPVIRTKPFDNFANLDGHHSE
jgi:hypothetical protein